MININTLPEPKVFYEIDYEKELSILEADFISKNPAYAGLIVESDPVKKLLELSAYNIVLLKVEANEKLKQTMLAFSTKENLDNIAANTVTPRLVVQYADPTANPPIPEILEDDEDLRYRAANAPKKWSVAGPRKAYELLALDVDGRIKQVGVQSHTPEAGDVTLSIITHDNNGAPDDELLNKIHKALTHEDVIPLNDTVFVYAAKFIDTIIQLKVTYYFGQDENSINNEIRKALKQLTNDTFKIGEELTLNAIHDAARVPGVQNIVIIEPSEDIQPVLNEVVRVTDVFLEHGGIYAAK